MYLIFIPSDIFYLFILFHNSYTWHITSLLSGYTVTFLLIIIYSKFYRRLSSHSLRRRDTVKTRWIPFNDKLSQTGFMANFYFNISLSSLVYTTRWINTFWIVLSCFPFSVHQQILSPYFIVSNQLNNFLILYWN